MSQDYYLKISRASNLQNKKERFLYRIFEILPGFLSFGTLIGLVLLSWLAPTFAALFSIIFVIYWLLRTLYLLLHLASGYQKMRKSEKTDWQKKLKEIQGWEKIYHLVILSTYKESYEILRQTFLGLQNADYIKDKMIVVLGIEESEGEEGVKKAELIQEEFGKVFFKFLITKHPKGIEGEMSGKGSNEAWAARKVREELIIPLAIPEENVILSSLDADTVVFPQYFGCLAYHFLKSADPVHTAFQPIPLFLNNIWQAPSMSRIFSFSSTFWQTMNQERPEKLITFSSYSMSFKALVEVGFKQVNVVSDDSRIFWQCFLQYNGNYRVQPLYYPVSMDANAAPTFLKTLIQIYKQQRRWAYGAADISYFLFGFIKNKKIALSKKISLGFELLEGHWTWATAPIVLFVIGWLPILLGGDHFSHTLLSYNLPRFTGRALNIATIGLLTSMVISINLLPARKPEYGKYGRFKLVLFALQWFLFPFSMIFFAALPALDAQMRLMLGKYMNFWPTPKFRNSKLL